MRVDWRKYPNFSKEEFDCKHTGQNKMLPEFMDVLQQIRTTYGKPMVISSGFRSVKHPIEVNKNKPGEHTYGAACDVRVSGTDVADLLVIAYGYGIRRFGIQQSGAMNSRFLHLGWGDKMPGFPATTWSY